jgi:GW (Gly-Tryp) dipeptide domain
MKISIIKLTRLSLIVITVIFFSCKSKPKVIVEDNQATNTPSSEKGEIKIDSSTVAANNSGGMHQVIAVEILQAERYTYLKVKENAETFWIATTKFDPKVGNKYMYQGGLLKTNFESLEHKRVFDKIFLVSSILDATEHPSGSNADVIPELPQTQATTQTKPAKKVEGALKLSDLFKDKDKFNGKTIIVQGKCVKANYGIMNKNWYHIQDGTMKDGKKCDFTITSAENIPLGAEVAFEGKIILNKDFGAGYFYDILMDGGKFK